MERKLLAHAVAALLAATLLAGPARAQVAENTATRGVFEHFFRYAKAALDGDLATVLASWHQDDLAAADRLGTVYQGEAPKVDGDSPLWTFVTALRDSAFGYRFGPPVILQTGPFAGHASLMLVVDPRGPNRATKQYLLEPDGHGGWLLARHERLLADRGPRTPGRFVTVAERRPGAPWTLPPHLTENLDAAVAAMAERLAMPPARLADLERGRFDYFLASPDVVAYIAGAPTVGVAILPSDAVLTSHPHHTHELAHLIVNAWLESPPLYTLPLLQEGLAVHLGGRWGRDPRVLDRVGRATIAGGAASLDDLLARADFHALSPDLTYPLAGVFCGYLLDAHGPDGMRAAYLAVCGSLDEVASWKAADVKHRLADALQRPWDDLAAGFAAWLADEPPAGIAPVDPSRGKGGREQRVGGLRARLTRDGDQDGVVVTSRQKEVARAALIFGGDGAEAAPNALFQEHFPGRAYRGETHALILTPDEARLYDYRREILVALHSEGFWPSDGAAQPYARDGGRTLSVALGAGLLPDDAWRLVPLD